MRTRPPGRDVIRWSAREPEGRGGSQTRQDRQRLRTCTHAYMTIRGKRTTRGRRDRLKRTTEDAITTMVEPHDAGFEVSCPTIGNTRLNGFHGAYTGQWFRNSRVVESSTVVRVRCDKPPPRGRHSHETTVRDRPAEPDRGLPGVNPRKSIYTRRFFGVQFSMSPGVSLECRLTAEPLDCCRSMWP